MFETLRCRLFLHLVRMQRRWPVALVALIAHSAWGQSEAAFPDAPRAAQHVETSVRRFELGGQIADTRVVCTGAGQCIYPSFALGPGGAFNVNGHLAIDAEANVTTGASREYSGVAGGRGAEFLVGPRIEARAEQYGFFLDARPGLMHWSHVLVPPYPFATGTRDLFVSDVGGGAEYSPDGRVHFRTEVSDIIVRDGPGAWGNHFHASVGIYAGLGRPIAWRPPVYEAKNAHRFFGNSNLLILTTTTLAMTADAITTQRFIGRGYKEGDPLAAPLVKYGWSGQIAAMGLELGGITAAMYGLHRIHQHWIERILPVGVAATHAVFAYNNTKVSDPGTRATLPQ